MQKGKFKKFGLTIHPKGGEEFEWNRMTKNKISENLQKLKYLTPNELSRVLLETRIFKEVKKNKVTGETKEYYSEMSDFGGQLELGDKNGTPHYQCWIELASKQTAMKVLKYYSTVIYGEEKSNAISIKVLTEDSEAYENYCIKEKRANLPGLYSHIKIDKTVGELDKYLEDNPEAKKYLMTLMDTKGILWNS